MITDYSSLSILKELVAIPSQNPMGFPHEGETWLESRMTEWLCEYFDSLNLPYEYHEVEPGRGNVVAILKGDEKRPTVLLDAHTDTVPVAGMTVDPFTPMEKDGRLYGRGSCDIKGGLSTILAVVAKLKIEGNRNHSTVMISCTCDEELGQKGAVEFIKRLSNSDDGRSILSGVKINEAIVSEPTDLNPVIAHKGTLRWKIKTTGVAAHSSDPSKGENAIYKMAKVIDYLEGQNQRLSQSKELEHPLCGLPSLSVGTISGGTSVNIVPDECVIEIDRRLIPGEQYEDVLENISNPSGKYSNLAFEALPIDIISPPLVDGENRNIADKLILAASGICDSKAIGVPFSTHAPHFAEFGIPTVVFGPGSIAQAHTKDEWIEIAQLDKAVEILQNYLTN